MIMVLNNKGTKTEQCKERYLFGTFQMKVNGSELMRKGKNDGKNNV